MAGTTDNPGSHNRNPADIGFWRLVGEDLATHDGRIFAQGFWALFWHRFGNWRMRVKPFVLRAPLTLIYRVMYKFSQWFCGMDLPYTVVVGRRVKLEHFGGMILVADRIGDDVIIRQNTTFGIAKPDGTFGRPKIGNGVQIGAGAVLLGDVEIGDHAQIGANAVVVKDVPPDVTVVGVPARPLETELPQTSNVELVSVSEPSLRDGTHD